MKITRHAKPKNTGCEYSVNAISPVINTTIPHKIAVGGPRRDWNHRSDVSPPANPPRIPKMHSSKPQCSL